MSFLSNWNFYNSGNEAPERFWRWAGISLLSHIAGRKYCYHHGKFPMVPAQYIGLIGDAGSGKSSAKGEVKSVIMEHFPHLVTSKSVQSREHIAKQMAAPEAVVTWTTPNGITDSYHSFYIIANEFENFLSVDPVNMVAFLVDIFDEKYFSTGYKNAESQSFANPYMSILSCGTPKWLMTELKMSLFEGGLGRRLLLVVDESTKLEPDPFMPDGWEQAKSRCIEHLKKVEAGQGVFTRSPDGKKWWHEWYRSYKAKKPEDPILAQFHSTIHVMILKVAMTLALSENPDGRILTGEYLEGAFEFIKDLFPKIAQLTSGIGRNELASIATQIIDFLERMKGACDWIKMRAIFRRYTSTKEFWDVLNDLQSTKQIDFADVYTDGPTMPPKRIVGFPQQIQLIIKASQERKELPHGN